MKKMQTSLAIAVALAAGVGTSAFAQNIKEDTVTFSMTVMQQASVSTSTTAANAGNWSQGPTHYKTASKKMTQVDLLKSIAIVLHGNPGFYSTQAKLVLVQGELGGFWNINDALAQSFADFKSNGEIWGSFNDEGTQFDNPFGPLTATFFPDDNLQYGPDSTGALDFSSTIPTLLDNNSRISLSDGPGSDFDAGGGAYARLATGRHFLPVPWQNGANETPFATTGQYPVGHMQPWGQFYVKDAGHKDSSGNPLCENVTFFFYLEVQECYDCFYLSSFISDANFTIKPGTQTGPPCCTSPGLLLGKGTDKYYLSLSFDNTINNSYLNPAIVTNDNEGQTVTFYYEYTGFTGLRPSAGVADGTSPDLLPYVDSIRSQLGRPSPYEARFTLNGIVTYNWNLALVSTGDVAADYIGTANYAYNGYGFIALVCSLINGTATFSEKSVKDIGCCDDVNWFDDTYNVYNTWFTGWFGPGYDGGWGYFNPDGDQFNPYPYLNLVGGEVYSGAGSPAYFYDLPNQFESPYNPEAALTQHLISNPTARNHNNVQALFNK